MSVGELKESLVGIPDHYGVVVAGEAFIDLGDESDVVDIRQEHGKSQVTLEVES